MAPNPPVRPDVIQRAGQNRDNDGASPGTRNRTVVIVALRASDRANNEQMTRITALMRNGVCDSLRALILTPCRRAWLAPDVIRRSSRRLSRSVRVRHHSQHGL